MADNADLRQTRTQFNFLTGSPGYTFLSNLLTFAGTQIDNNTQYLLSDIACMNIVLTMLYEIWQGTAAGQLYNDFDNSGQNISGYWTFLDFDHQYVNATIDIVNRGTPQKVTIGSPNIYDYGWAQWQYGYGGGKLHKIRFDQTFMLPEAIFPSGINISLKPGVTANVTLRRKPVDLNEMQVNSGASTSFFGGIAGNVGDTGFIDAQQPVLANVQQTFKWNGWPGKFLTSAFTETLTWERGNTDNFTSMQIWKLMIAWCQEIWESVLINQAGFTSQDVQIKNTGQFTTQNNTTVKTVTFTMANDTVPIDWEWGQTGFLYLGKIAPIYPFGIGEIQYLNSASVQMLPTQPCIGFAWWLKPGVVMNVEYQTELGICRGVTWKGQRLSLVDGVVSALAL